MRARELTCVSLSKCEHSAAAPAVIRASSLLSPARFATLLQLRNRSVPITSDTSIGKVPDVVSPLEPDELQGTDQVWHVADGRGRRDRYPKSDRRQSVSISQTGGT